MGLLDDAIREHLELKRRRGADASEVDRLEHEALGPVRREPFESSSQDSVTGLETRDGPYEEPYDEESADDWGDPFADELERPSSQLSTDDAPATTADRAASELAPEPEPEHRSRRWRRSRRESAPPEEAGSTEAEPEDAPGGDETVEYGVDDAVAARGRGRKESLEPDQPLSDDDGDVLEETPEFLQDAPEHDRLWFEQRPPRDFDFDD